MSDEYKKNDTLANFSDAAPVTTGRVFLFIKTDNAPEETTWDIKNSAGTIVGSGGPYTTSGTMQKDTVDLSAYDCYTFNLYDAGGNGLYLRQRERSFLCGGRRRQYHRRRQCLRLPYF
ncbi:MAG: hypothetical protein MZV70_67010 [Desulfobacterales bacterium]|nr:hypothetical protein [Desulfobacterales bacterium]